MTEAANTTPSEEWLIVAVLLLSVSSSTPVTVTDWRLPQLDVLNHRSAGLTVTAPMSELVTETSPVVGGRFSSDTRIDSSADGARFSPALA